MKKFKAFRALLLMLTLVFALGSPSVAFAATDIGTTVTKIETGVNDEKNGTEYSKALTTLKKALSKYQKYSGTDAVPVTISGTTNNISPADYNKLCLLGETELNAVTTSIESVDDSSVDGVQNKITGMVHNFDISADTGSATAALEGFRKPIGMIVGILAWVVITGMGLFTALDIAYIVIPVFRGWYSDSAQSGSRVTGTTDHKTGEAKLRWISDEAVYAVKVSVVGEGKSPIKIYLFKRMGAYIMVALVIFMLLTGNVQIFVNLALSLVSGVIEQIQILAN